MTPQFTILTVCTGNVHRSALAASLLETWAGWYLPAPLTGHVHVRSAGFAAPVGAAMGRRVQAVARALGADGSAHHATLLTDDMLDAADLILVASARQRGEALQRMPGALRRTFTIREAGRISAAMDPVHRPLVVRDLVATVGRMADARHAVGDPSLDDIIDPQGRDDDAYVQMVREELEPLAHLGHALLGMPEGDRTAYLAAARDPGSLLAGFADAGPR